MYNKFNDLPQNLKDKFQGYNITAKYESQRKVYTERSKKSYEKKFLFLASVIYSK